MILYSLIIVKNVERKDELVAYLGDSYLALKSGMRGCK